MIQIVNNDPFQVKIDTYVHTYNQIRGQVGNQLWSRRPRPIMGKIWNHVKDQLNETD